MKEVENSLFIKVLFHWKLGHNGWPSRPSAKNGGGSYPTFPNFIILAPASVHILGLPCINQPEISYISHSHICTGTHHSSPAQLLLSGGPGGSYFSSLDSFTRSRRREKGSSPFPKHLGESMWKRPQQRKWEKKCSPFMFSDCIMKRMRQVHRAARQEWCWRNGGQAQGQDISH